MAERGSTRLVVAAGRLAAEVLAALPVAARRAPSPSPTSPAGAVRALGRLSEDLLGAFDRTDDRDVRTRLVELLGRVDRLEARLRRAVRDEAGGAADDVARGVVDLHGCQSADELVRLVSSIALRACRADRAVSGLLHEGAWVGLDVTHRDEPPRSLRGAGGPKPLAALRAERLAVETGRPVRAPARPDDAPVPLDRPCIVVPLLVDGRARGMLHLCFPDDLVTDDRVARAADLGMAIGYVFEARDLRDQLTDLDGTVARLRDLLGTRTAEHSDVGTLLRGLPGRATSAGVAAAGTSGSLTPRQRETLELMLLGLSNAQIAERMLVSLPTVKSHVRAILRGVGAVNRAEAIGRYSGSAPGSNE